MYSKNAPNLGKWDFNGCVDNICTNMTWLGDNGYRCSGHGRGDKITPSHHGDPAREFKFWVYPPNQKL